MTILTIFPQVSKLYKEQRALNCCVRVLLVCECRRWQRVSVALPALSPGADACRRILNGCQCAIGLSNFPEN